MTTGHFPGLLLTMMRMYAYLAILATFIVKTEAGCVFPPDWYGRWYQSGLGEVTIYEHSIDKKGICKDRHDDIYLLYNRQGNCHQCLIIMMRHRNIIQYKESYCIDADSLNEVCAQIRVEAILYTLVREPALPVKCPFKDAYHFNYNNNTGGFCMDPSSYVKTCASNAKFRFEFRHCADAAYTYDTENDFECLATWKDGSDMYMYGGFVDNSLTNKDDIYRCFMYNVFGTVVYLAMSADATCRGLRSPRDGPLVMEFTKDVFGWPQPACVFPRWLTNSTWQDLAGQHLFIPDSMGEMISVTYRRHMHSIPHVKYAYRCMKVQLDNTTNREFIAVSFTSHDCNTRFQCVKFVMRHDNVIELHRGAHVLSESDRCYPIHFATSVVHTLIPRNLPPRPCPFTGRYYITPDSSGCRLDVRSGCNRTSRIDITSSCVAQPAGQLECLESWNEHDRNYVIVRRLGQNPDVTNCFSFRKFGDTIELATDKKCNFGAPDIFDQEIDYRLDPNPASCEDHIETRIRPVEEKPLSQQEHQSYGAGSGYKHTGIDDDGDYNDDKRDTTRYLTSITTKLRCSSGLLALVNCVIFSLMSWR